MLKQLVARRLKRNDYPFWQPRYYDFNIFTHKEWREKLRYLHRNPVTRGLLRSQKIGRGAATVIGSREK